MKIKNYNINFLTEHVVSIIANMLRNCRGTQRQRLMTKFSENDMEKVDRLMELHFKYMEKVEAIDATIDEKVKYYDFITLKNFNQIYNLIISKYP